MRALFFILLIVSMRFTASVRAEDLAAGISRDKIDIDSSFKGTEVAVFGSIEGTSGNPFSPPSQRDIVVVVKSDRPVSTVVRKKERIGGIWINREAHRFVGVPEYYFLASTRALDKIANAEVLQQFEIGLQHIRFGPAPGVVGGPKLFREAFIAGQTKGDLYAQHEGAVSFLSTTLFRTTVTLPPNIPAGNLKVSVYAFLNGQVTSNSSMTLFVDKTGIERQLSEFAQFWPLFYGLSAVLLSGLAGFAAAFAFQQRQ